MVVAVFVHLAGERTMVYDIGHLPTFALDFLAAAVSDFGDRQGDRE